MKITDKFVFFWDGSFSNWSYAKFKLLGHSFSNSEQAFMWLKAMCFLDENTASKILLETSPKGVKDLGRQVKGYDDTKWNTLRCEMMYNACLEKFAQNEDLKKELLATSNRILIEASPYDKIWGIGMGENEAGIEDEKNWKGLNLLGQTLMKVRDRLTS